MYLSLSLLFQIPSEAAQSCREDGCGKENKSVCQNEGSKQTRVKKVPDFKKLHDKWQQKMEKVEREERREII